MWTAIVAIAVLTPLQALLTLGVQGPPLKMILLVGVAALAVITITAKLLPARSTGPAHSGKALALWFITVVAALFLNEAVLTAVTAQATNSVIATELVFYCFVFGIGLSARTWARTTEATASWALLCSQVPAVVFLVTYAMSPTRGGSDVVFAISKFIGRSALLPIDFAVLIIGWRVANTLAALQARGAPERGH